VLVTLAAIAFGRALGLEIEVDLTVIAAFLTIIGYSINDTIVVFDRIRENLPRSALKLRDLIDLSVNQTLSRSILTSLTVFIAMAILYAFNAGQHNSLEAFAFAMLAGVVTGSYSTIFVASAILADVADRSERKKAALPAVAQPRAASGTS